MGLRELDGLVKLEYKSGVDRVVQDFYVPCLTHSIKYDRAVGYFTSESLRLAARGLLRFVKKEGSKMRLLASPYLGEADIQAMQSKIPEEQVAFIRGLVAGSFADALAVVDSKHLEFMSWMIQDGKLEIKLAYRPSHNGIYHEKIGIFTDEAGERIAFTGSMNETRGGMQSNYESIDAYTQWRDPERVESKAGHFEQLWSGSLPGLTVVDFTQASEDLLKRYRRTASSPRPDDAYFDDIDGTELPVVSDAKGTYSGLDYIGVVRAPEGFQARPYQLEAVKAWAAANGKGMFAMATGSGKTLTALCCAAHAQKKNRRLIVIVAAPYKHLCDQWALDVERFGVLAIPCYDSRESWFGTLRASMIKLEDMEEGCLVACVTNATLQSPDFRSLIRSAKRPVFFIGDEVHNLGADGANAALPGNASLRLGLSATPVRAGDEEGTAKISEYFGKTVAEFTLDQAIEQGFLTPYEYHPVFVKLTDYEAEEYIKLTKQYARLMASSRPEHLAMAETKLFERARVLGAAYNKLGALLSLLSKNGLRKGLIYCSDGVMHGLDGNEIGTQIDEVVKALRAPPHSFNVNRFTHDVKSAEVRKQMIYELSNDMLNGLVAIRCLDEGVDVPSLEVAYILASSKNPRQSIQRRGRLLRKSPGKERSVIYDFIIEPPGFSNDTDAEALMWEKKLFEAELSRGMEFARLAINRQEAEQKFNLVRERCKF